MPITIFGLPENSIITLRYQGVHDDQTVMVTFAYKLKFGEGVMDDPPWDEALGQMKLGLEGVGGMDELFLDAVSEDMVSISKFLQPISPTRLVQIEYTVGLGIGTGPADTLPPNSAATFALRVQTAVPRDKASKHMPAVPAEWADLGRITNAGLAAYSSFAARCVEEIPITVAGNDYIMIPVILKRDTPVNSQQVFDYVVNNKVRTQRSRTVGLGI